MTILDQAMDGPGTGLRGADVWDAAVQTAVRLLTLRPLHEITLDDVAIRIGVPVESVREQIPDLNELLIAAIQYWHTDRMQLVHANAARSCCCASC